MKGKTKTQKGMTLVALVITIVVLLILAVVTIRSIVDDGVITTVNNVATKYNDSVSEEDDVLQQYSNFLSDQIANPGGGSSSTTGLKEGDKVAYDSDGDGKTEEWIVLTDRNGLVEIISAKAMGKLTLGYNSNTSGDPEDFLNEQDKAIGAYSAAIKTINNYCKSLVKEEIRDKVRSVGLGKDRERMQVLGIVNVGTDYWMADANEYVMEDGTILYTVTVVERRRISLVCLGSRRLGDS